jgi:signal transduction histidine kinase
MTPAPATPARWRASWLDALLAVAVAGAGVVEAYGRAGPGPGHVHRPDLVAAGALAAGVLLLLRRRFPVGTLTALSAVFRVAVTDDDYPLAAWQFYSNLILVHTVGSQSTGPRRRAAGVLAVLAAYALLQTLPSQDVAESLIGAIFMGVAYGSGILLRRQTQRTVRMAQRAAVAATDERTRIARELHDVISHNVSLMTLQTGGVRLLLGTDRERERDLLRGVERAGRDTVEELRMLLGVLRDGRPPAGLDRLDELAGPLRAAGLDVRLTVAGPARPLPPSLGLAVYRVVQEALTNTLKHAGAASVDVTIGFTPGELAVEVRDDGTGGAAGSGGAGPGHGLVGMGERVALHGGTLRTGARPGGGYAVTATFPLTAGA